MRVFVCVYYFITYYLCVGLALSMFFFSYTTIFLIEYNFHTKYNLIIELDYYRRDDLAADALLITASISSTVLGHTVRLSIPLSVTNTSSSRRTPPVP